MNSAAKFNRWSALNGFDTTQILERLIFLSDSELSASDDRPKDHRYKKYNSYCNHT